MASPATSSTWQAAAARLAATLRIAPHVRRSPVAGRHRDPGGGHAPRRQRPARRRPSRWHTVRAASWRGSGVGSKPLSGILTLGTPHGGSLLAQRGLDVLGFNYTLYNLVGLATAFGTGTEFEWIYVALRDHYAMALQLSWGTAVSLAATTAVMNHVPVAPQLVPGSAYLQGLNGAGNLAREASAVSKRVGLTFAADQYWRAGAAVGLAPHQREWSSAATVTLPPTFEYAAVYIEQRYGPLNMPARSFAARLRDLAGAIRELDPLWCWAVTDDRQCRMPHDGIVSVAAQSLPQRRQPRRDRPGAHAGNRAQRS